MYAKLKNLLLYPFSLLYGLLTEARNILYDKKILRSSEFDIAIINVGNLSAGGNGKTPMTLMLAGMLSPHYRIAILSRGYGRKSKGFREVQIGDSALQAGDEPLLIKQQLQNSAAVFVGERRVEAIMEILSLRPDTQVIILDDAYQHRAVKAGLNLLLTDYRHLFIQDHLLPMGRLREAKKGAGRADAIIVSKCPDRMPAEEQEQIRRALNTYCNTVFFTGLRYGQILPILNTSDKAQPDAFYLVSGIAKPGPLLQYAKSRYRLDAYKFFPDHHQYTEKDIESIEKKIRSFAGSKVAVLTTEKDAVRFKDYFDRKRQFSFPLYALPIEVTLPQDNKSQFENLINNYVREGSTDSSIHSR